MKKGIILVPPELLLGLLGEISGTILGIRINHFKSGQVEVVLEGPDMPDCGEGEYPRVFELKEIKSGKLA